MHKYRRWWCYKAECHLEQKNKIHIEMWIASITAPHGTSIWISTESSAVALLWESFLGKTLRKKARFASRIGSIFSCILVRMKCQRGSSLSHAVYMHHTIRKATKNHTTEDVMRAGRSDVVKHSKENAPRNVSILPHQMSFHLKWIKGNNNCTPT